MAFGLPVQPLKVIYMQTCSSPLMEWTLLRKKMQEMILEAAAGPLGDHISILVSGRTGVDV